MKQEERLFELMDQLPDEVLAQTEAPKKRRRWVPAVAAACLLLAVGLGVWGGGLTAPGSGPNDTASSVTTPGQAQPDNTVNDRSDAEHGPELSWPKLNGTYIDEAVHFSMLPVENRMAEYHEVENPNGIPTAQRPRYLGESYRDLEDWYLPEDNNGLQYLLHREEDGSYTLWEFAYFVVWDEETQSQVAYDMEHTENYIWAEIEWFSLDMDFSPYRYSEVLETVYGVTSADDLTSLTVDPANMDNTDAGKALQKKIGARTVTDRAGLDALYDAISDMLCYGSGNWDKIDRGDNISDDGLLEAVRLGRYLTIQTAGGAVIDDLKYSAAGGQFYEYSGVAYEPLDAETAATMDQLFGIA